MMYLGNQAVGLNNNTLQLVQSYTLQESWENDSLGNSFTVINTLLPNLSSYSAQYLFVIEFKNNQTQKTDYKVDYIVTGNFGTTASTSERDGFTIRNNYSVRRPNAKSTSTWASIGTVISIYKIKIGGDT